MSIATHPPTDHRAPFRALKKETPDPEVTISPCAALLLALLAPMPAAALAAVAPMIYIALAKEPT